MQLMIQPSDLFKVGHDVFEEDGFLNVLTYPETCGVDEILLRSILRYFGDYTVTDISDVHWGENHIDMALQTSMPWSEYLDIRDDIELYKESN